MKTLLTRLALGVLLCTSPAEAQDEAYSLESRAAIGALWAGNFLRVWRRAEEVAAEGF